MQENNGNIGRYSFKLIALSAAAVGKYGIARLVPTTNPKPSPTESSKFATGKTVFACGKAYYDTAMVLTDRKSGRSASIEDAVCTASRITNIVKTPLCDMSGTVKEYISAEDWDLQISFNIVALENGEMVDKYPCEGVEFVNELFSTKTALEVEKSDFLAMLGVTKLVVKKVSITQQTHSNIQQVGIEALSDEDFEIKNNEY